MMVVERRVELFGGAVDTSVCASTDVIPVWPVNRPAYGSQALIDLRRVYSDA